MNDHPPFPFYAGHFASENLINLREQSVQTASDHLVYGIGSQACPGRFFAAHEARVIMARILLNYDFKLKKPYPNRHPMDTASGVMTTPDWNVAFSFKRRDPNA